MLSSHTRRGGPALLLAAAAAVCYAGLWLGYSQGWHWLAAVDAATLRPGCAIGVAHPGWVRLWDVLCTVLAPVTFRLLGVGLIVVALTARRLRTALLVLISVEFSGLLTQAAKDLADRPRPVTALVGASSSSFPSGHALAAMVGVAAALAVLLPVVAGRARVVLVVLGALIVLAVGVGRIALNVHHLSDVVAGWALGGMFFLICAWLTGADGDRVPPVAPVGVW